MALDPVDLQAMQIANDPTLPPEERKARIDQLYAPPIAQVSGGGGVGNVPDFAGVAPPVQPIGGGGTLNVPAEPIAAAPPPGTEGQGGFQYGGEESTLPQDTVPNQSIAPAEVPGAPAATPGNIKFNTPATAATPQEPFAFPVAPARAVQTGTDTFQPVSRTIQGKVPLNPETEAGTQGAEQAEIKGFEEEQAAAQHAREVSRAAQAEKDTEKQNLRAVYEANRKDFQRQLEDRNIAYQQAGDELARVSAEKPFNANRFWANKSVGDKIMTTLAIALGEIGKGLTKGATSNVTLDRMNREISDDIQEQREEHQAKVEGAAGKVRATGNLYEHFRDMGFNDLEAQQASMQAAWEAIDREVGRFQDGLQDPVRKAQADQIRAQMEQKVNQAREAREAAHVGTITEQYRYDPKRWVSGGGIDLRKHIAIAQGLDKVTPGSGEKYLRAIGFQGLGGGAEQQHSHPLAVQDVHGQILGYAADPVSARGYRGNVAAYASVEKAANRLIELQRQGGTTVGSQAQKYEAARQKYILELANFYAVTGKANLADVHAWEDVIPGGKAPADWAAAAIRQAADDAHGSLNERLGTGLFKTPPVTKKGAADELIQQSIAESGTGEE